MAILGVVVVGVKRKESVEEISRYIWQGAKAREGGGGREAEGTHAQGRAHLTTSSAGKAKEILFFGGDIGNVI